MAGLDDLGTETSIAFTRLQELLELTPGNLITHLRRLEEAGYVQTTEGGRKRGTDVAMTARGARAFADHPTGAAGDAGHLRGSRSVVRLDRRTEDPS